MKRFLKNILCTFLLMLCQNVFSETGLLLEVKDSGPSASIDMILCLNAAGKEPISCQHYHVSKLTFHIRAIANHTYPNAGIKILTPGYTTGNCKHSPAPGFCLFEANSVTATEVDVVTSNGVLSLSSNGSTTLPQATSGIPYSTTIEVSGGVPPYHYSITGQLPPGLSLNPTTGEISGIPSGNGTFTFTINVTDSNTPPASGSQTFSMNVSGLTLSPAQLSDGELAAAYPTTSISASGGTGPFTFVVSFGNLPPGLDLNPDGTLSGTPILVGTFSFTVKATASNGKTGFQSYTIRIYTGLAVAASPDPLPVDLGQTATLIATASGGRLPYTYQWYLCSNASCTMATLIPGANGATYNAPTGTTGTFYYRVVVIDSLMVAASSNVVTVIVNNALSVMVTPGVWNVDLNQSAIFTAMPSGGTPPYFYQWFRCTDSSCTTVIEISGANSSSYSAPTTSAGVFYFYVVVKDSAASPVIVQSIVVILNVGNTLSATVTPTIINAGSGQTAVFTCNPLGGTSPFSFIWYSCTNPSCTSRAPVAPPATSANYSPPTTSAGTFIFQCDVTDSAAPPVTASSNSATLNVDAPFSVMATPSTLNVTTGGTAVFTATPSGGTSPYTYLWEKCNNLPSCTSFSPAPGTNTNATYSADTSTAGTFKFRVTATDSFGPPQQTATSNVVTLTVSTLFSTPGSASYTVPAGVTSLTIVAKGAGGGGLINSGGSGGMVTSTLSVSPGQLLSLFIGSAGVSGASGGGGSSSNIDAGTTNQIIAGGGGGGGDSGSAAGGAGGGCGAGSGCSGGGIGGIGGAGGAGGTGGSSPGATSGGNGGNGVGGAGGASGSGSAGGTGSGGLGNGGAGAFNFASGGGGGGGYGGGGGGGAKPPLGPSSGGGGGGGSTGPAGSVFSVAGNVGGNGSIMITPN